MFTLAAAFLLLPLGQALQALHELHLPGLEVGLDAAVTALRHVTVALSPGHESHGAQHPKPLVYILAHLEREVQDSNEGVGLLLTTQHLALNKQTT